MTRKTRLRTLVLDENHIANEEDTLTTTTTTVVNREVIAVMDNCGAEVGGIVWWSLHGTVRPDDLEDAWKTEGLDESLLPDPPAPRKALGLAMDRLSEERRLRRPLAARQGYSLVQESAQEERLEYAQQVTAKVDATGTLVIEPSDHQLADQIRHEYSTCLDQLGHTDLSALLIRLTESLSGIGLRDRGGFYFVPPSKVATFRAGARALAACSAVVCYEIPAMRSEEAVRAILAGLQGEVAQKVSELTETLDAGEAGERALRTKVRECAKAEQKVSEYAALLGQNLTELTGRLESIRARLTEAAMIAASVKK